MREQNDLTDEFRAAITDSIGAPIDTNRGETTIETRLCSSDNYDGVEYTFTRPYVPIRPILDVVADTDGVNIEHMGFNNETSEPCLKVFVANTGTQAPHPAFTEE
jgi:hypothetical protein